jgi:hypothetical protein
LVEGVSLFVDNQLCNCLPHSSRRDHFRSRSEPNVLSPCEGPNSRLLPYLHPILRWTENPFRGRSGCAWFLPILTNRWESSRVLSLSAPSYPPKWTVSIPYRAMPRDCLLSCLARRVVKVCSASVKTDIAATARAWKSEIVSPALKNLRFTIATLL